MSALTFMDAISSAVGDNDDAQKVTQWIDTGFAPLNEILSGSPSGGLPFGRLIEVFGESATGKTALATMWMANAQKMGGVAGFIDWERSFNVELAKTFGLDSDDRWVYKRPKTWEEGNMHASKVCQTIREKKLIDADAPILFIFDSIAAAVPKSQAEKDINEYTMNDTTALARVTSTTLKVQAQWAAEYNACFVYLNQLRLKHGVVYGDPRTTPGGKAMEFYASGRLSLGRQKIMEQGADGKEFTGQMVSIECVKSKFTKPFQSTSLRMGFDENGACRFDITSSLVDYCIEKGKLPWSKPRATWTDGKQYFKKALVEKIDTEGLQDELHKLATT